MERYIRSFASADEVIELATVRSEMITKDGMTVSHDTHQPGWRWSTDVKPLVGTEWCQVHHVGVVLRARVGYRLEDGTEFEAGPLDLMDIPPGHDAWVIGDEQVETIAWTGAKGWLAPLESFTDRSWPAFSDVVGSTSLAGRIGDRAFGDLMAAFEARTRDVLAHYRGREVKMTGDGVLAVFDGSARALRCARAMREVAAGLGLQLRTTVHSGEVELAGTDVRGIAVHEASRMLGLAAPGEILASAIVVQLTSDASLSFEDRGEHELRGLSGVRHLYALGS